MWLCVDVCVCVDVCGCVRGGVWMCVPQFADVVAAQRTGSTRDGTDRSQVYPFGITAINITCMLTGVLGIDTAAPLAKTAFWEVRAQTSSRGMSCLVVLVRATKVCRMLTCQIFCDGDAFFELFNIAFRHFDVTWTKFGVGCVVCAEIIAAFRSSWRDTCR